MHLPVYFFNVIVCIEVEKKKPIKDKQPDLESISTHTHTLVMCWKI